jgi:hypothetical protein
VRQSVVTVRDQASFALLTDRDEHGGRQGQAHLVHEDGRSLVEEMGVVDEDHRRTPLGISDR